MTEDILEERHPPLEKKSGTASVPYLQSPAYRDWFQAGGDIDDFIFYEEHSGHSER